MSVKVCPECGAEYVGSVTECADDGTPLVVSDTEEMAAEIDEEVALAHDRDEADLGGPELAGQADGDQVAYELDGWDPQARVLLDQLLNGESVMHVWEATTLVVRAADEAQVDELVEQVEVTSQPALDPDKDQVVYEMADWPDQQRDALMESLVEAGVPFGFDENDDLVVHEEDDERTEAILDQVDFNFSVDADDVAADTSDEGDGLEAQDAMSELFVAADRLKRAADDPAGVLRFTDAARAVEGLAVPYGFAPSVWQDIVTRSAALRALLEGEDGAPASVDGGDGELAGDEAPIDAPVDDAERDVLDAEGHDGAEADQADVADAADDELVGEVLLEEGAADDGPTDLGSTDSGSMDSGSTLDGATVDDRALSEAARELRDILRQYV